MALDVSPPPSPAPARPTRTEIDPTKKLDDYLLDPNYYRLAHQLVAEYANRAASQTFAPGPTPSPTEPASTPTPPQLGELLAEGRGEASDRVAEIEAVLAHFTIRSQAHFWRVDVKRNVGPKPNNQEERLRLFLVTTVDPCIRLIAAGIEAMSAAPDPTRWVALPPPATPRKDGDPPPAPATGNHPLGNGWSPRAFYNLACYYSLRTSYGNWAEREVDENLLRALSHQRPTATARRVNPGLWALQQALRQSHGTDRGSLRDQAQRDVTLRPLLEDPQIGSEARDLLQRYTTPSPGSGTKSDPPAGSEPPASAPEAPSPPAPEKELSAEAFQTFQDAQVKEQWDLSLAYRVLKAGRARAQNSDAGAMPETVDAWLNVPQSLS